ncbi:DUF3298 domain-containing protein [Paenibacillus sp. VCA1]|uniref:stalk domain-containing protein n=1 Tax=Paenibacillus sp. VCA1 TaxID=3039148 RepID=UPI00287155AE|nr:DUF3298 domain-containing protein [Paenibacillus sp. VCA1]MDR9854875.1 DUF3298 domain-containing protein [Paenibacillus sp. VCA1]
MKKKTMKRITLSAAGAAVILGMSAAGLPVHAMASVQAPAIVSANMQAAAPVAKGVTLSEKVLKSTTPYLTAHIKVPQLAGMLDTHYQDEWNDIMLSHAQKDLANWEKEAAEAAAKAKKAHQEFRPYELTITYSLKSAGTGIPAGIISLEIVTEGSTGGTSMPRIDTYNVKNAAAAERVTLSDLLGDDYKAKLDADILAQMKKDPEKYFLEDYKGTSEEQTFYIENGELAVVFPKYSIAPGYVGSPEFRFALKGQSAGKTNHESGLKLDLKKAATYKNARGTEMVALRDAALQLGYELKWNPSSKTAEVRKGAQWTSVTVGKDAYSYAKTAPRALGAAPVLRQNKLYVPVRFISDMLKVEVLR